MCSAQFEDASVELGFRDIVVEADKQAAVAVTPGHAHFVRNIDPAGRTLYLSVCVDMPFNSTDPATDYQVWSTASIMAASLD